MFTGNNIFFSTCPEHKSTSDTETAEQFRKFSVREIPGLYQTNIIKVFIKLPTTSISSSREQIMGAPHGN